MPPGARLTVTVLVTTIVALLHLRAVPRAHSASILAALEASQNASKSVTMPDIPNAAHCVHNAGRYSHDWVADEVVRVQDLHITMASTSRLASTIWLAWTALHLPGGDFVETGVWKGGTSVLMMKVLLTFDSCKRSFWAFDTFNGMPKLVKHDKVGPLAKGKAGKFKASREAYVSNLQDYGAYDPEVVVVTEGIFRDTLPQSKVAHISFLRLDGKLFEATRDALENLYDRVIPGGCVYINDYRTYNGCNRAVDDFREKRNITIPMHEVDDIDWRGNACHEAVWWMK